ncbi:MAG TPA: hypothetical protein VL403_09135 [Candidatus Kryptonia bacterium]|nr:hypothetical protein [Candidatus Kryptonia bacterium]
MRRTLAVLTLSLIGITGIVIVALRPAAEEIDSGEAPKVSEQDFQTYVGVYTAMQNDHDLTIERALEPYKMDVDAFRQIERQVQSDERLTDKARHALLTQAQNRSAFALAPTATAAAGDAAATPTASKGKP